MHKKYHVKSNDRSTTIMEISSELPSGYMVRLRREDEWDTREQVEFMSETLFRTCLRTGYITPVSETVTETQTENHSGSESVPA